MARLRALLDRYAAPVDYGPIRSRLQWVRAFAASLLGAAALVRVATGVTHTWAPAAAALAVAVHALTRGVRRASPTESLIVDALCLAGGLSVVRHTDLVVVAGAAYFVAASIAFGGIRSFVIVLPTFAAAVAIANALPIPTPEVLPTRPLLWVTVAVFLAGVTICLTTAAGAVARARHRQEEALTMQRRAAEMKNEFASMVTHELRTPLTNIAGFAVTLRDSWSQLSPDEADEFLRIIVSEAEHLGHLVDDVLALPRLEAGRLLVETVDFALQPAAFKVTDLIFPVGGDRSASVSVSGKVRVHADPNRVEQILRNLLENARKYGGDQVSVDAVRRGQEWVVVVADNGPGVPAEHRDRIFGAFEQATAGDARTESGFGLGLAVVRHLVEAMGGRIWYEPGFPVGARFCFTLPAARRETRAVA